MTTPQETEGAQLLEALEKEDDDEDEEETPNTTTEDDGTTKKKTPQKRKGSKNAGSKKGCTRVERPQSFWYHLCELFEQGDYKSQIEFLRSPDSGADVTDALRMHFSRAYKKYRNGTLANIEESRARKRKYEPLEQRLIEYWTKQQELIGEQDHDNLEDGGDSQSDGVYYEVGTTDEYGMEASNNNKKKGQKGKSPLAWNVLQQKAREWAKEMGLDDGFQASAGWIDNVFKRHQREVEAKRKRLSIGDTLAQRRTLANYASSRAALEKELFVADQVALLKAKGLKVGDRVTLQDVSGKAGDLVVAQVVLPPESKTGGLNRKDSTNSNGDNSDDQPHAYLILERKRHGSTQTYPVTDVRKVVLHQGVQEEDTATIRQLLQPHLDPFQAAIAHFLKALPECSRALRPIWEDNDDEQQLSTTTAVKETTSVRIPLTDTSCAEKIDLQALQSHILPMFQRDQKGRMKLMKELENMPQRSAVQQKVLEKLQYAQLTHDMARDFSSEIVDKIPTKGACVVYQVDYQALDTSMRGHLFAQVPAPFAPSDSPKSYAPRPLTLQAMPEDLRNALVGQFCHLVTTDQDMKADIFCSLADMAQVTNLIPAWLEYRSRTNDWIDFIQQTHEGISQQQAELLPRILLQGGTYGTWKQAMDEQTAISVSSSDETWASLESFVMRLENEWKILRDIVLTLPQYSWTKLDRAALLNSHEYAPSAIPNICMVRILQACEREVWTLVSHVLQSQGWVVRAKLIEGVLVESPSPTESLAAAMSVAETAMKSRGWSVILIEGSCFGKYSGANHKAPLPLLQEARMAMEMLQPSMGPERTGDDSTVPMAGDSTLETNPADWKDNSAPNNHANNDEMGASEVAKPQLNLFAQL